MSSVYLDTDLGYPVAARAHFLLPLFLLHMLVTNSRYFLQIMDINPRSVKYEAVDNIKI